MIHRLRKLLIIVAVIGCAGFVPLLTAPAANALPIVGDCKTAPSPQTPANGLSGWVDPGPTHYDPAAKGVYPTIEYPPRWHTYDLGCKGDFLASFDTFAGNGLKGLATLAVAGANSLHRLVSPPKFLSALDPAVIEISSALHDSVYVPFIGVSLALIAVVIIWDARKKKNFHRAVDAVGWALIVMTASTMLWEYPVKAGQFFDKEATNIIGFINQKIEGSPNEHEDPATARAELITQTALYNEWEMGEFGWSAGGSPDAKKYAGRALHDQALTYLEASHLKNAEGLYKPHSFQRGNNRKHVITDKKADFRKLAAQIQHDGTSYDDFKGQGISRIGVGALSDFATGCIVPFMFMADLLIVAALYITRYLVMFAPAIAPFCAWLRAKPLAMKFVARIFGGVFNAIFFSIGAAVNAVLVRAWLTPQTRLPGETPLPVWARLLMCAFTTVILWKAFKPLRRMGKLVSFGKVTDAAESAMGDMKDGAKKKTRKFGRKAKRSVSSTFRHRSSSSSSKSGGSGSRSSSAEDSDEEESTEPPAELWTRPLPTEPPPPAPPAAPVASPAAAPVTASWSDQRHPPRDDDTDTDPTAPPPAGEQEPDPARPYTASEPRLLYDPDEPLPIDREPTSPRSDPVVTSEGLVWRIWDPETKTYRVIEREVPADGHG